MKFNGLKLTSMESIIIKLERSGLNITQIIEALKVYVTPNLDYLMSNSIVSEVNLDKLDKLIRKVINSQVGGRPLSKNIFYTSCKNGGLNLKNLKERYTACKMNSLAHFYLSNEESRCFIKNQLKAEAKWRKIEKTNEETYFFNWHVNTQDPLKGGHRSLIEEVYKTAHRDQIGIRHNRETNEIELWSDNPKKIFICKKGGTAKAIMTRFERRHFTELLAQKVRGRCISTFFYSPVSNFYIDN
jgi:hypothetical protein